MGRAGHSVLQVPVPGLERFVRARTAHHDPAYLSSEADFGHAHVTALGPFLAAPSTVDLGAVAEIARATEPFGVVLRRVAVFPDGIVHSPVEGAAPFLALTERLVRRFPECPPYEGRYAVLVPHVTLDALGPGVDVASTRALLGDALPCVGIAERLDLAWYEPDGCRVLASWPLGDRPTARSEVRGP